MRAIILCTAVVAAAGASAQAAAPPAALDNAVVRAWRTADVSSLPHGNGVVVFINSSSAHGAGDAVWMNDVAAAADVTGGAEVVVVQPKAAAAAAGPEEGSKPGDAPFTGMSFRTLFENDRVAVLRARMDVGAREAFHTHASDTVVVHLSGGSIEDTAGGVTKVNRWKHGDVEFEARGSSHSARNVGGAVDVVLVTLKPQAR